MAPDQRPESTTQETIREHGFLNWSRRNVLKLTGTGAGLAALAGMGVPGASQEDNATPTDDGDQTPSGDTVDEDDLGDLVDPVFGYPIASDDTNDGTVEHVVDVAFQDGQGAHENFPEEPNPDAPGQFVEIPAEFFFDPVGLHVEPDSYVRFDLGAGLHTVTAFHDKFSDPHLEVPRRVPDGVPGFTSPPMVSGESWIYQFTEPGVYDYFCFPHLGLGMVGRIVVFSPGEDDIDSDEFAAPSTGVFPQDERVFAAEELDPANIVDEGSVAWEDITIEAVPSTPAGTVTPTPTNGGADTD